MSVNFAAAKGMVEAAMGTCHGFEKSAEAGFHTVFQVALGKFNAILRFPNASVKNASDVVRSEQATMTFLREAHGFPIPRVYTWSADLEGDGIGSPYIFMEHIPGVPFEDALHEGKVSNCLWRQIAQIQDRLARIPLARIGSIYRREDLPPHLADSPLY
ncbi:hypothetical protein DACRYDRAFT_108692 [Dacryopinax primogenitus]|uniref:Aminoglycoside phosphotransferase domain-containing protein n=1 Tax=Dacryopinax primogenitus (strain DJM 731) TaxID=1858805 RepID=M5G9W3_DACPD|nr:uncharacterized protein DACRYDRAFT_108692 [Dacryopinax primogenitus]EJU00628.1 hypothetical protein DACRYDRAFT_108692 [Dacryopinax primogenitus]